MPIPFLHPSTILIAGPSQSGKTVMARKILTEQMLCPNPTRILVIYSDWQKEYDKIKILKPFAEFVKGPVSDKLYDELDTKENNVILFDDQLTEIAKSKQIEKFFVQGSHHKNLTIIFISQNIFEKGSAFRTCSLNTKYLILYKNPRDKAQIGALARQIYPSRWRNFLAAFESATKQPYSYFLIDLKADTPEEHRLRGNIFSNINSPGTDIYIIDV